MLGRKKRRREAAEEAGYRRAADLTEEIRRREGLPVSPDEDEEETSRKVAEAVEAAWKAVAEADEAADKAVDASWKAYRTLERVEEERYPEPVIRTARLNSFRTNELEDEAKDYASAARLIAEEAGRLVGEAAAEESWIPEIRVSEADEAAARAAVEAYHAIKAAYEAIAIADEEPEKKVAEAARKRKEARASATRKRKAGISASGNRPVSVFPEGGPYRIAALDFETANEYRGSPCAIGIVLSDNGKIVHKERRLFRPPEGVDEFDEFNISLHGITPGMVKDKPRYGEVLPGILEVIGSRPVVAHNAAFDMGVIRDACDTSGIARPSLSYICTLVLSRTVLDLPSYTLPIVAEELGISLEDHHEPVADAEAAARILFLLAERIETDITELLDPIRIGYMRPDEWKGCQKKRYGSGGKGGRKPEIPESNLDASDNFFYGKKVVLTGKLPYEISRQEAWDKIASLGGNPNKNITRKTDLLVIGEWNAWNLSPDGYSLKYKKAEALRADGIKIETLSGLDFLALLEEAVAESRVEEAAAEAVS